MSSFKELKEKIQLELKELEPKISSEEKHLSKLELEVYEKAEKEAKLKSLIQDIEERKKYAWWIFWVLVVWLFAILVIIILVGTHTLELSDTVIVSLITTTTINVAGFFLIVTKYLFPDHK